MTEADIKSVIQLFADAALRVKKSGFNGGQIYVAHSYLLAQFISPLYNKRTDAYGGSKENRFRIVAEVYEAIRKAVGAEYPVWIKINSSDEVPGGLTVDEFVWMGKKLSEIGVDAIEVSGELWTMHKPNERVYYKDAAIRLANDVTTPVILTGGLRERKDIEAIATKSKVQFFGFARPFAANPNFIDTLYDN